MHSYFVSCHAKLSNLFTMFMDDFPDYIQRQKGEALLNFIVTKGSGEIFEFGAPPDSPQPRLAPPSSPQPQFARPRSPQPRLQNPYRVIFRPQDNNQLEPEIVIDLDDISSSDNDDGDSTVTQSTSDTATHQPLDGWVFKVKGIRWDTQNIPGRPMLTNSCTIDSFLTSIKIQFGRKKFNFKANFKWTRGSGKKIEDGLRRLIQLCHQHDGNLMIEDELNVKLVWAEIIGMPQSNFYDFMGNEWNKIFDHINQLLYFKMYFKCGCKKPNGQDKEEVVPSTSLCVRAPNDFLDIFRGYPRCPKIDIEKRCQVCNQDYVHHRAVFPDTTWILLMEQSDRGTNFSQDLFPIELQYGNVTWKKAYASYVKINPGINYGHLISLHCIKGKSYLYDDSSRSGRLCHVIGQMPTQYCFLQRVVYFREPPKNY